MMRGIAAILLLCTCVFGADGPQSQDFVIPNDNDFAAEFGTVEPGDVLIVNVTAAPGCTILESEVKGGDPGWVGGGTTFTARVPADWSGQHQGRFGGTYTCGDGGSGPPPPWSGSAVAKALSLTHLTKAHTPADRTRTKLGVCEEVTITASQSVRWSTSAGSLSQAFGTQTILTAPNVASKVTVTATCPDGTTAAVTFDVIIPEYIEMTASAPYYHYKGRPSSGFTGLDVHLTPKDVSFYAIEVREGEAIGIGTGVFARYDGLKHLSSRKTTVRQDNWVNFKDTVFSDGDPAPDGNHVGTFTWPIKWHYICHGGEFPFATITHHAVSDAAGTTTVSKDGASKTFALDDEDQDL